MTTYSKADFFTIYRGWNNKIACYSSGKFKQLTARQLEALKDCTIEINGTAYKVTLSSVTKI